MRRYDKILRGFLVLGLACFACWSCAAPGTAGKSAKGDAASEQKGKPSQEKMAADQGGRLLGVQIQDAGDEASVVMTGTMPFHDYQFRRLGEDRFVVELAGVKDRTSLPVLPPSSEKVRLSYGEGGESDRLQILGTMYSPLDRYVMNTAGNDLVLNLYFSGSKAGYGAEAVSPPLGPSPAETRTKPVARKSSQNPRGKSQAATRRTPAQAHGDESVFAADTPPAAAGLAKKQYVGKPISLDLVDADLRNVLRLISDLTGINLVIEPDVAGRVTLKVERVPWDQVLDMVLAMNNLGKEQVGGVIRIARQDKLKQEWDQTKNEILARQELLEIAKDVGDINTVYFSVNYAQPADIAKKIEVNKSEKGRVEVDDRSSLIIYSDYPARIENARRLLARLDRATPQVLIEARIVTMSSDVTRDLGINWRVQGRSGAAKLGEPTFSRDFEVNIPAQIPFSFSIAEVINNTLMNVDLLLAAQEQMARVNVLAAPKVLTLNHKKAVINQGQQIPYLKLSDLNVASTEFKDAVLELQVTPHITPDRKIRLEIQAKQDEPSAQTFQVGTSLVPGIDSRRINTELLVDDGNIVVIGGVLRRNDTEGTTATPGLYKIPILGRLFRIDNTRNIRQELVIFISPKIIEATSPPTRG
ncbi:MAG: type IV pilus secretin PilQ [Deltaproteobacteria bacterium]|nr:type IV pilus secretin PilQ [Deltaproteobacteria bacterium]